MGKMPEGAPQEKTIKDERADALFQEFVTDLWAVWAKHQRAEKVLAPDETYRVLCQALITVSSVGAVDVGITLEQFVGMAAATWTTAKNKAPKFS